MQTQLIASCWRRLNHFLGEWQAEKTPKKKEAKPEKVEAEPSEPAATPER